jgi:hypothetical protein
MGLLEDQMAEDAVNMMDTDGFAETIGYTPVGGVLVDIPAVVRRMTPIPNPASGQDIQPRAIIVVANAAPPAGISSASLNTGGDTVTLALRIGGTVETHRVKLPKTMEPNDPGCLTLEI